MSEPEPLIRNVSNTARWVAVYRAHESERPDALFRDPLAKRLAGSHGEEIAAKMPYRGRDSWPFVVRTYLFDQFISSQVERGIGMVINLGAGLDARPYRMALPESFKWIEGGPSPNPRIKGRGSGGRKACVHPGASPVGPCERHCPA